MHWCGEETAMLLAAIPFLAYAWAWVRARLGIRRKAPQACASCGDSHGHAVPEGGGDGHAAGEHGRAEGPAVLRG